MHGHVAPSALRKHKLYLSLIEVVRRRKEKKRKTQLAFDNGYIQVRMEPWEGQPPNWEKEGVNATFSHLINEWEMAKTHPAMAKTKVGRHGRKRLLLFEGKMGHLDYFRKEKPRPCLGVWVSGTAHPCSVEHNQSKRPSSHSCEQLLGAILSKMTASTTCVTAAV